MAHTSVVRSLMATFAVFSAVFKTYESITAVFTYNNIHEKLLDSDWLRANIMQFKCNASAKSVTPVQFTPHNSRL